MYKKILSILMIMISFSFISCSGSSTIQGNDRHGDAGTNNYNNTAINNSNNYDNSLNNNSSGTGANIGGAQDFGTFRQIVENGGIPNSSLLDANGFFSEHYIKLPNTQCEHSVCLYTMLARGRSIIANDFMTVLALTMVSPIKPQDYERPPTDFVFVLDRSGSMYMENKLEYMKQGIIRMLDELKEDDRVAIVVYDDQIETLSPLLPVVENKTQLKNAINDIYPRGQTDIYNAIKKGFSIIEERAPEDATRPARLIFLSDGQPTAGILDKDAIIGMASEHIHVGINMTSIGVGSDINYDLMKNLAMEGGNFYFVEDAASLIDIFVQEANFFPVPIAENARIYLNKNNSFYLGSPIGFPQWEDTSDGGFAQFKNLYLASRTSEESENSHSRRGGGSIMFMKLVPQNQDLSLIGLNGALVYYDPLDATDVSLEYQYNTYFGTESLPVENEYFSDAMAIKSFAILNTYLVLQRVLKSIEESHYANYEVYKNCEVLDLLNSAINYIQERNDQLVDQGEASADGDDDLIADKTLLIQLKQNIATYYSCYEYDEYCNKDNDCVNPHDQDYIDADDEGEYVTEHNGCSTTGKGTPSIMIIISLLISIAITNRKKPIK